jgi:hypothetical protein
MNDILWGLFFTALSAIASWFFSRMYFRKSLANQEAEADRERSALVEALRARNATDHTLVMQQYINAAVEAWKRNGTAVQYLESLTDVAREQKSQILRAASLRHKGREPKNNPYIS